MTTQQSTRYTIAICKGSALIEETKTLLRAWRPGESLSDFRTRVLRDDVLGKTTAYRANDIVRRVFAARFLGKNGDPALYLKRLVESGMHADVVSDLCLLYAARRDPLWRDVVTELYWPAVARHQSTITRDDVVAFLNKAEEHGFMDVPWSDKVKVKVARGLMKALLDFGMLAERERRQREFRSFHATDGAIIFLAYNLHFSGATDPGVISDRDWRLYGYHDRHVAGALDRLSGDGWWLAQIAGSVVRVSWRYSNMEEVVDAIIAR